jgi:hypothetical protein
VLTVSAQAIRDYETLSQETLKNNPFVPRKGSQPSVMQPYLEIAPYVRTYKLRELDKRGRLLRADKNAWLERLVLGTLVVSC